MSTMLGVSFVEVRAATDCPAGDEIASHLRPMLPSGWSMGPAGDVASVELAEPQADGSVGIHLRLVRPDGSSGGERSLVLQGGCAEMAEAVATIIATWETDFALATPPVAARSVPAVVAPARPAPVSQGRSDIPAGWDFSLGATVGAAMIGGVAATVGAEVAAGRVTSLWRLRIAASTQTARQLTFGQGEVSWKHTTIALGLVLRTAGPRWRFSVDAGPVLGWATLGGQGYDENRTASPFEYGLGGALRVERAVGRFAIWVEWRTNVWPRSQEAMLTGSSASVTLSGFDMMANLGGSFTYVR